MVAYYGNYTIITDKLAQFVNTFLESTGAGVGNLIAEGNKDNIKSLLGTYFHSLFYWRRYIFCYLYVNQSIYSIMVRR